MTPTVAGLPLVERLEPHGRVRLVLVDDSEGSSQDVCALTIDPLQLHGGSGGLVSVGGIGNVATLERHRRRGLATQLLHVAIDRMRNAGLDASLLYGIDGFYEPLGWRSCGDERWVEFDVAASLGDDDQATVRAMRHDDRAALVATYRQIAACTPGAVVRSDRTWERLDPDEVTLVHRGGELVGWAWRGRGMDARGIVQQGTPDCVAFVELQAVDLDAARSVLRAARAMVASSDEAHLAHLATGAPDGHAIRDLGRATGARLVDEHRPSGGAMLLPFTNIAQRVAAGGYQFIPDRF